LDLEAEVLAVPTLGIKTQLLILLQLLLQGVEDIMASLSNATQHFILVVGQISLRQNDFDILEDNFETLDPDKVNGKYPASDHGLTHSSEIALNWSGASTNRDRISFASSRALAKSLTPKPKLIVTLNTAPPMSNREVC
jgi:hypothetical protein